MILYHIILLAIIQGLTEFLPVSSSGHLGLYHCFTDQCEYWDSKNLTMDIAVHVGTLMAVLLYFRTDVLHMLCGVKNIATGNMSSEHSRLTLYILVSSVPVIVAGFILHNFEPDGLKTIHVIAWTTIIFGIILWWTDKKSPAERTIKDMTFKDAVIIGAAQVLALIPGTSRSGITMTASRYLGLSRVESAHYSMLLSIIAISGAGTLVGLSLVESNNISLGFDVIVAVILSFVSGWIAIAVMMKFLKTSTFTVFALYRVLLGGALLGLLYGGVIS